MSKPSRGGMEVQVKREGMRNGIAEGRLRVALLNTWRSCAVGVRGCGLSGNGLVNYGPMVSRGCKTRKVLDSQTEAR